MSEFGLDDVRAAVLTIDLHRGHLDPDTATLPVGSPRDRRVVAANVRFLDAVRALGLPVVHVVTEYRAVEEVTSNPFWSAIAGTGATRGNILAHQLPGTPNTALMPGILRDGDHVVGRKRRYDCFRATDLEFTLRGLGVNLLAITGVNTNSCVLATTIVASTKDFACVVVSDCVDTVDGDDDHRSALSMIERAFGWVMPADDVLPSLRIATNRQLEVPQNR